MNAGNAFAHPAFVRLWLGSVATNVGTQMNNVAKAWVLYQLTHSAVALGVEGLCFSTPMAVLPLVAGPLADRLDRVALVRATLVAEAAQAFVLAALAQSGDLQPWMLYVAATLDATRLAIAIPAQSAIVPNVVPAEALQGALAISSATWSSSALVGPMLGGLLLVAGGAPSVFAVNGVTTVVAVIALAGVVAPMVPYHKVESGWAQLAGGVRYLRRDHRGLQLQWALLVAMTGVLGVETLLPVFATRTWHAGSVGYGLLRTAPGLAAVLGGVALLRFRVRGRRLLPAAMACAAAGLAGFAAAPPLAAALAVLTLASLFFTVAQIVAASELQLRVPDEVRGRVAALSAVGQNGLAGIGAVVVAAAAGGVGASCALAVLAVAVLAGTVPLVWASAETGARQDVQLPPRTGISRRRQRRSDCLRGR